MFWVHLLMHFLLHFYVSNGKCIIEKDLFDVRNRILECIAVDEEQLLTFIEENDCDVEQLKIENSFVPHIEIFPLCGDNKDISLLMIKNSRVSSILPLCQVMNLCELENINVEFNELKDMHFLKDLHQIRTIVMTHNQVEFLDDLSFDSLLHLDLSFNKIKNFTALRSSNLLSLNLSYNLLEEITDLFEYTFWLQKIDLSYNKLKAVSSNDFKSLKNIITLNLSNNNIHVFQHIGQILHKCGTFNYNKFNVLIYYTSVIDLSHNNLTESIHFEEDNACYDTKICLGNNYLKDSRFSMNNDSMIEINSLIYRDAKIKSLHHYNFRGLTVRSLDFSSNEIEILPEAVFEGLNVLELNLDHNKIESLDDHSFSGISQLERLNLSFNPLKTISSKAFANLSLNTIDLSHCHLTLFPDDITKRVYSKIFLNNNEIEAVQIDNSTSLEILDVSHNKIKKLDEYTFSGIYIRLYLNLSNNPLSSLKGIFKNTWIYNINLNRLCLKNISVYDVEGLNVTDHLNLSSSGINELGSNTFDQLPNLKNIYLDNNSIQMIPSNFFGFNDKLESLSIVRNPISFIPLDAFSHKMKLKYLYLTVYGRMMKKRFFNLIYLKKLHIIDSVITDLHKYSFRGLISLEELNFKNSTCAKIEPGAFWGLRNVIIFDSQNLFANTSTLKTKNFVGLEKLKILNLSNIGVSAIEDEAFLGLDSLLNLNLSQNKIGDLPKNSFAGLKMLRELDLSNNNLTGKESTFPIGIFKDLLQLTHLHLQFNRIIKFHIGEFSNLRNLKFLNLSHNQLSYLDRHLLFPLRNLEVLDINSNHVIRFDYHFTLKHLSALKFVGIGNNKWPCENMTIMLNDFEKQGVDYREISKLDFDVENMGGIYCVHLCNYLYCPTEDDF